MTPSHAPEHLWTVVAVVACGYAFLIGWVVKLCIDFRRVRRNTLALEAERLARKDTAVRRGRTR